MTRSLVDSEIKYFARTDESLPIRSKVEISNTNDSKVFIFGYVYFGENYGVSKL